VIDLPFEHAHNLVSFLTPVFEHTLYEPTQSTGLKFTLGILETVIALAGIAVAWTLYKGGRSRPELEPAFLANVWYWDDFYDATIGRPGTKLANAAAEADTKVLDRAVNGIGSLAVAKARALRTLSTGQVRQYALAIIAGVAALLVFLLMRTF
jgi:NADH:ubiquinone oxidoreductase subunit 5 (subunit L)/multisubunit Na+/H+ antiporter MnhA subunit